MRVQKGLEFQASLSTLDIKQKSGVTQLCSGRSKIVKTSQETATVVSIGGDEGNN